ncbi:transporter substrate-binding domain-containing protein [Glaciimonas sp. PCH181]|uniref:transporter substrate-binding domain-containing protein n=1 Tax=Glaciimonas sp. PCH181 TaxID=2133943 RepID=UPI000D3C6E69|nr:transporter substrate-binding domain-containing protein [Glaciimonas sp. PCH181]PUA18864.1 amino acid ABC transporter substrate-binding protein [Glaciimonas sp. PCH181]
MKLKQHRRSAIKAAIATAIIAFLPALAMAEGGTLADIKARGQLTVGTEAAYEPYEYVENGVIVGYGHDILEYMATKLGVKLVQLNLPFQGLLPGLMSHKFDFVATSVGITEERAKRFAFSRPVGIVHAMLVVNATNKTIVKPDDAVGKTVGTQMGSQAQPVIQEFERQMKAKSGKGFAELKLFQAYPDVSVALKNGTLDIGVIPSNVLSVQMRRQPGAFKAIGEVGEPRLLGWVANPQDPAIRTFINQTLEEMQANGKLVELQKKWFGEALNLPTSGYLPKGAL